MDKYFTKVMFKWRGLGNIPSSGLELKDEYSKYNAKIIYKDVLPMQEIEDHKLCICGDILRGIANPDCTYLENL